jgi:hypothetical protein
MGLSYLPVSDLPEAGDIVYCRFPKTGLPLSQTPRLCIVRAVNEIDDPKEGVVGVVTVIYGTGNIEDGNRSSDFFIEDRSEREAVGLTKPTVFFINRSHIKPITWCAQYFVTPGYFRYERLVKGRLTPSHISALQQKLSAAGL